MQPVDSDIAAWIAGAQSGEPASYDRIVDAYADRLYGYFYRLTGNRADAEDLLQETFIRLVRAIGRYEHQELFDAFLFRIATNLYRDLLRKKKRSRELASLDQSQSIDEGVAMIQHMASTQHPPDAGLAQTEMNQTLQTALAALPGPEREVILMRHFSDMSFKDIAELMGTPLGTALARAHRGLAKLKQLVEERMR